MFSLKVLIRLSVQYMCVSEGFFSSEQLKCYGIILLYYSSAANDREYEQKTGKETVTKSKRDSYYTRRNDENPTATANSKWQRNENHSMHCEALVIHKLISIRCVCVCEYEYEWQYLNGMDDV